MSGPGGRALEARCGAQARRARALELAGDARAQIHAVEAKIERAIHCRDQGVWNGDEEVKAACRRSTSGKPEAHCGRIERAGGTLSTLDWRRATEHNIRMRARPSSSRGA